MVNYQGLPEMNSIGSEEFDEGWWSSVLADEEAHREEMRTIGVGEPQQSTIEVDWAQAMVAFHQDDVLKLVVYGFNRGGVLVQTDGIQGFVPISHLVEIQPGLTEEERRDILSEYIGRELELKIIECEPKQERIVLSERAALAGGGCRKGIFSTLCEDDITTGTVTNITDFGAFVDLGGVEGLIHVSELSWGRVQHPSELLSIGDKVDVLVMAINEETGRIALSLKRLSSNPWETISARYRPGDVVAATITTNMRYGVFARLDEGVEGLIHISTISLPKNQKDASKLLQPGMRVQVRILHIDRERRRLGLGLAQIE